MEFKQRTEVMAKQIETIEKRGDPKKIKVFDDKFDSLQLEIIKILKNNQECCTNYGLLYLYLLEKQDIIKINYIPKKLISPESISRIRRKLIEYAGYGNKELDFLLEYTKENNLCKESKEFYRNN